jgi:hypothetical protein
MIRFTDDAGEDWEKLRFLAKTAPAAWPNSVSSK